MRIITVFLIIADRMPKPTEIARVRGVTKAPVIRTIALLHDGGYIQRLQASLTT